MIARTAVAGAAALLAGLTAAVPAHADPAVTVPATYTLLADAGAGGGSQPVLLMGDQTVEVDASVTADLTPGQKVTATVRGATGTAEQVVDAIDDGRARVTAARATSAALPTALAGAHELTIVPVTTGTADSTTVGTLTQMGRQLGDFWSAQTSGALTVPDADITVHDWVTGSAISANDCDPEQWQDAALEALGRTADSFTGREHLVIYMAAKNSTCGWAGLAYMPGNTIWLNGYGYADGFEHEFGHNLGLGHAGDETCGYVAAGSAITQNCEVVEYGDYDVMGYARYGDGNGLNTSKADELGLLKSVTPAAGTRVTLAPRSDRSGVRAVKVTGTDATYYVEYRPDPAAGTAGEQDSPSPGVQVRKVADGDNVSTLLPALRYTGDSDPQNASLPTGQAMALPGTGFDVVHESGSVVYLRAASTESITAPTLQAPADGGSTGLTSTISWSAAANSATAIAGYLLIVDGTQYVQSPSQLSRQVTLTAGSHQVTVATLSSQGDISDTRTATFTATTTTTRPSAPKVTFPPQGAAATTSVLRWQAVSGAAKYTVTVDGTTKTLSAGTTKLVLSLARGTHTLAVRAYNSAGAASDPVTATITVNRTWAATAGKITAPSNGAKVAASATLKWAAPSVRTGDPLVSGYDLRTDSGTWVSVSAATRSRVVKLAAGKHTLTVRTRYETGATAQVTVKVTR
ncbi:hypothetical protein BJ973_002606 [Actinoplanes tereljensis]|uniref:Peptidase M11 gametolysin domain-containing protein n=1 Tax=Paractinoplanes tereljensis TaxID=571912 RepID=A0A919TVU2_9ACTN|nr:hypothetical protein [Actinoplanes tereljensis]GIF22282.1 hypothetical protein Ate02nite_50120 [Actinoplanes tereljensis]